MTKICDVVVIGAGIHGAGVAQAVAAAGHSVIVLEKNGIASGTSSRSSKLIHGGLRYLESGQFRLVRECLHERSLLLKLAPDLVRLQPFFIPVYRQTSRSSLVIRCGLTIYALLGGMNTANRFTTVPRRNWDTLDQIETNGLQTVFQYWDAQTNDADLTRAVMQSAISLGATALIPAKVSGIDLHKDGCAVHYQYNDKQETCITKVIINASGPWANQLLDLVSSPINKAPVNLVQGTHIILNRKLTKGIYYLESPVDKRAVFAIPWKNQCLVGTTETRFDLEPDLVKPLDEEIFYLLNTMNHYFPHSIATHNEIVNSFAGLRVLPAGDNSAFSRPRETILHTDRESSPRILTIYGGKLTAYRHTASTVLERVACVLPNSNPVADTRKLSLTPIDDINL
ncbi:MAG: glycerol-3-phosphate dehydrogenase/oxidase [Gammaproteobacteria bacterium]